MSLDINFNSMTKREQQKALFLLKTALDLSMDISNGHLGVNNSSGYTFLWIEDYPWTLYMPVSCELNLDGVWVLWESPEDGEGFEICLNDKKILWNIEAKSHNLIDKLYAWVEMVENSKEVELD